MLTLFMQVISTAFKALLPYHCSNFVPAISFSSYICMSIAGILKTSVLIYGLVHLTIIISITISIFLFRQNKNSLSFTYSTIFPMKKI
jgi:hypothetical protein